MFTGWFLYLGTLIPVIGLVQVGDQAMADRYTYLPSIGILIILVWGTYTFFNKEHIRKTFLFPAAMIILAALAILTYRQCGYWKNSSTLYNYVLRVTEDNYKIHHNMGASLFKEGKIHEAEYHFDRAVKINPNYLSFNSRGEIYARAGKYQQAFDDFNKAISLNPQHPDGYYNRGVTYDVTGQFQPALADFNKSISLDSNHVNSYNNRGIVYAKLNRFQEAIEDFTKIISINPNYVHAYLNRAKVYFKLGQHELAAKDYNEAMRLNNKR
jgi:tetratricopeptide (TPR) repeat protein